MSEAERAEGSGEGPAEGAVEGAVAGAAGEHVEEHVGDSVEEGTSDKADADTPGADVLFDAPPLPELERMIEAILFASAEPLTRPQIEERLPHGSDASAAIESLRKRYEGRGVALVRIGPAWAFRTAPDLGFLMRREAQDTRRLSRAAIETLAIIAYHQPTTRAEIEEIRGVSVSRGTLDLLLELDWIKLGRRRETPGRPVTFVTTSSFLDHFGLESARDLPGIRELRAAGLLDSRPPLGEGLSLEDDDTPPGEDDDTEDMFEQDAAEQDAAEQDGAEQDGAELDAPDGEELSAAPEHGDLSEASASSEEPQPR